MGCGFGALEGGGVHKRGVSMVTSSMLGVFREDARTRKEFLSFIEGGRR